MLTAGPLYAVFLSTSLLVSWKPPLIMKMGDMHSCDSTRSWMVSYLEQQRLVMAYMAVSAVAIFYYNYLLTLRLEIKLIWFSPWSYTK